MLKKSELLIDSVWNGQISAFIEGHLETRRYYGYTKEEAIRNFLGEFNN